jgi:hypothetical protein
MPHSVIVVQDAAFFSAFDSAYFCMHFTAFLRSVSHQDRPVYVLHG